MVRRMKRLALFFLSTLLFAEAAAAAPIWIERRAVPDAELLDERFAAHDERSALSVDHAAWDDFLKTYVVAGEDGVNRVRYAAVDADARASLNGYIAALEATDVSALSWAEQNAFWINLYNAATIRLILDNPGVASIRTIKKPWGRPVATVSGFALTLGDVEQGVVRPAFNDPRNHYALNCASLGCPNLARNAYVGARLDAQIDEAARAFINHPRGFRIEDGRVVASKIYGWYKKDFGDSDTEILDHVRAYASPELRRSLDDVRDIDDFQYDWALNAAE